jgi:uncharacterized Ntn-hydrolase superfamily protein
LARTSIAVVVVMGQAGLSTTEWAILQPHSNDDQDDPDDDLNRILVYWRDQGQHDVVVHPGPL